MKKKFFVAFFIIVIVFVSANLFWKHFFGKDLLCLLKLTDENYAYIDKYYVYGTHLNISGSLDISFNVDNAYIVFKNQNDELTYDLKYQVVDNKLLFETSSLINDGICLDDIKISDYLVFLKIVDNDIVKYYSLKNDTKYNDVEYYTVTRNNKNNQVKINFNSKKNKEYLCINVKESSSDYYDVVIDAGHGGDDPGANYNNYNEADITLDYALSLKKELEKLGLKVKLTRSDDIYIDTYGKNSRTAIPYEAKAKYVFSIHLNSCEEVTSGGVEIYAPHNANLDFATSLAKNIKIEANTKYSNNESNKIEDGVYIRTFTKEEITESISEAKENGYNPYAITTDTNYYFIIRETGGFMTGAYVDGRNKDYDKNEYYNSNVGAEGYLLELGYINNRSDLNNLLNNKRGYINGIVSSIKNELNL
ncbi:MAG: N-acetylmuramoyl-L-alanine amidase [Bacilli bacterium]|nr:N-acetylmuramoyl-L-alanine amidase [Bacilli bacterium]